MQNVTVAIADVDRDRRAEYERLLHDEDGITLLSMSAQVMEIDDHAFVKPSGQATHGCFGLRE